MPVCATSDAILILAGVFGLGILKRFQLDWLCAYAGSHFYFYGFYAIKSAIKGGKSLEADGVLKSPYKAVISC